MTVHRAADAASDSRDERAELVEHLRQSGSRLSWDAGAVLFREGDEGDFTVLVDSGEIQVTVTDGDGRAHVLNVCGPGEPVGELAGLRGGRRSATAVAVTPVQGVVVPAAMLRRALDETPGASAALLDVIGERLRQANAGRIEVAARSADLTEAVTLFRRDGDVWTVRFEGRTVRLRHNKGMAYIARLLRTPWQEVHVLDLVGEDGAAGRGANVTPADGLQQEGRGDELLDATARAAYRRRVEDLQDTITEAEQWGDAERAARARDELDTLLAELSAATGIGGRSRRAPDAGERARKAVYNRVWSAVDKIGAHHPDLHRHLSRAIRTGIFCSYQPEQPTAWTIG